MNANNGYQGWSMSNRAAEAYNSGEMPISKWTKKIILENVENTYGEALAKAVSAWTLKTLQRVFLESAGWHHTSKFFNKTDFYAFNESLETTENEMWESRNIKYYPLTTKQFYETLSPYSKNSEIECCYEKIELNVLSKQAYFNQAKQKIAEKKKIENQEIKLYNQHKIFEILENNFDKMPFDKKIRYAKGNIRKVETYRGASLFISGFEVLRKEKYGFSRKYNEMDRLFDFLKIK